MKSSSDIDTVRIQAVLSSVAGFPFLFCFSFAWIGAGCLSYVVPLEIVPFIYWLSGLPAIPLAIALERRIGYVPPPKPDPLLPLTLQLMFIQVVAFPAFLPFLGSDAYYFPVAFAAVVGAHLLPLQWVYRTPLYGVLGVVIAVGPFLLIVFLGNKAMHYTGFFVGLTLLVGAFFARSHAAATWLESQRPAQHGDGSER